MPQEHQPRNHAERTEAVAALETYRQRPDADANLIALDDQVCAPLRIRYLTCRQAYLTATAQARSAAILLQTGDERVERCARNWSGTVRGPDGRSRVPELSRLTEGRSLSEICCCNDREQQRLLLKLLAGLSVRPELQGDPQLLAELQQAVADFEPLITAEEQAGRLKLQAGRDQAEATREFDRAYSKFARIVRATLGDQAGAILPRFLRKNPPEPTGADE